MITWSTIIAVEIGLSELIKRLGVVPAKYIPLVNLASGILLSMVFGGEADWRNSLFNGVILGLSASGLYSGAKNVAEGLRS